MLQTMAPTSGSLGVADLLAAQIPNGSWVARSWSWIQKCRPAMECTRTLATLGLPRGALVITIARGGDFLLPGGQTEIRVDDALLVLADRGAALATEKLVAGEAQVLP
jgi:hypothetical protein